MPRSFLLIIALAGFALGHFALAQSGETFRVEGSVMDAETGAPIQGAKVQSWGMRDGPMTLTDKDGSFSLPLQNRGAYRLRAAGDGYLTDLSTQLKDCSPCKVTIKLHTMAVFQGRVVAEDTKEPLAKITVEAIPATGNDDLLTASPFETEQTNRNGEFFLRQLIPGAYYFKFTSQGGGATMIIVDPTDVSTQHFIRQWWPGGDTYRGATPFTVLAGSTFHMPDLKMPAEIRFQISGTVAAQTCQVGTGYTVAIAMRGDSGTRAFQSMVVHCGYSFTFADLKPGGYQLRLSAGDSEQVVARRDLVVSDRDLQAELSP